MTPGLVTAKVTLWALLQPPTPPDPPAAPTSTPTSPAPARDNYLAKIPFKVHGDFEGFCAAELTFTVWCVSSGSVQQFKV